MKHKQKSTCLFFFLFAVTILLLVPQSASADMGPKPSIDFEIVYATPGALDIVDAELLQCQDANCVDYKPLVKKGMGPQHFTCQNDSCTSMAYGYAQFQKLEITFSDGKTRKSNIFTKTSFSEQYKVTVNPDDLNVESKGGSANPLFIILAITFIGIIILIAMGVAFLVLLIQLFIKAKKEDPDFNNSRKKLIALWLLSLPFIAFGSYYSLTILLTVILEGVATAIFAWRMKKNALASVSFVTFGNVITQLGLLATIQNTISIANLPLLIIPEVIIWSLESIIIFLGQRQSYSFKNAMTLSAIINLISFAVGMLLPV